MRSEPAPVPALGPRHWNQFGNPSTVVARYDFGCGLNFSLRSTPPRPIIGKSNWKAVLNPDTDEIQIYCETIGLGTCCADDDIELFVAPINGLDSSWCASLDAGRNEVNLMFSFRKP
jgi:hypothetical protein